MARVTAGELRATRISQENEFDFYLSFTKRIILGLPDIAERIKAASWVKSLRDRPESQLRTDYLKLLLFALQRKQLIGPFRGVPPEGKLEPFPEGSTILNVAHNILAHEAESQGAGDSYSLPAVTTAISSDLKEYAAVQTIPNFGVHCYYAVSSEGIAYWHKSDLGNYPSQSAINNVLAWEESTARISQPKLILEPSDDDLASKIPISSDTEQCFKLVAEDTSQKMPVPTPEMTWDSNSRLHEKRPHLIFDESDRDCKRHGEGQLTMDEEAFSILDRSLHNGTKITLREGYLKGLPPDLPERRMHAIDDSANLAAMPCRTHRFSTTTQERNNTTQHGMNFDDWSNNCPPFSPARASSEHEYPQFFSTNMDDTIKSDSISCDEIISRVNAFGRRWNLAWAMSNSDDAAKQNNTGCSPLPTDESYRKLCTPAANPTSTRSRQFTKQYPTCGAFTSSPGPSSRPCPKPLPSKLTNSEIPDHQHSSSFYYSNTSANYDTTGPCSEPTSEFGKIHSSRKESSDEQYYTSRIKQTTAEELGLSPFSYNSDESSEYYNPTLGEKPIPIHSEQSKYQSKPCKSNTVDSSILDSTESSFQPLANSSLLDRQLGSLENSLVTPTMVKMYAHRKQILGEEDAKKFLKDAKEWHRKERIRECKNENVRVRIPRPPEGRYDRGGRKLPLASQETTPLLTPVPQTCPSSIKHTLPDNWSQTDYCPEILEGEQPPSEYYELDSSDEGDNEPWQGRHGMYGCQYIPKPPDIFRYTRPPEGQYSAGGRKLPLAPQKPIQSLSSRLIPGIDCAMRIRRAREAKELCKTDDTHRETVQRRPCLKKPASYKYPIPKPCPPNVTQTTDNFGLADYSQDMLKDEDPPSDYFDLAPSDEDENGIGQGIKRCNYISSFIKPPGIRGNQLKSSDNKPMTCICPNTPERNVQWAPNENVGCFTSVPSDAEFGFNSDFTPEFANSTTKPLCLEFGNPVSEVNERDLYLKPTANFEMESSEVEQSYGYSPNIFGDDIINDNKWTLEEDSPISAPPPRLVRQSDSTQSWESTQGHAINTNLYSNPPLDTSSEINTETASGEGLLDFLDSRQIHNPFPECDYGEETQLMYDNMIWHDGTSVESNLRGAER